jgi:hypothetical protein
VVARDPVNTAVGDAVVGDAELTSAAAHLASTAIAQAQFFLEHGSPAAQLRIVSSLLPAIGRALATQGEDEELAELRAQLRGLQQSMLDAS